MNEKSSEVSKNSQSEKKGVTIYFHEIELDTLKLVADAINTSVSNLVRATTMNLLAATIQRDSPRIYIEPFAKFLEEQERRDEIVARNGM